jgi:4-hydroxy-tetrahydrodipicolinate reductase
MSDMKLVVVGAAGRMGQALIRAIAKKDGVVLHGAVLHAAVERKGAKQIGMDAGEVAGIGPIGVSITDDPLRAFANADGVLDFTIPAATTEFASYAAQARIVHIIGLCTR